MWILMPLAFLGLAVLLHGVATRLPLRLDVVRRFLLVGIPLGVALLVLSLQTLGFTPATFAAILLYAFLCELYIFCFTLVLSSVSVTVLILLLRGAVPLGALSARYDPRAMVTLRLDRLIQQGLVSRSEGRIAVTARGMRLHRTFTFLQRFFGHEPS
jgi:hypothetical protein